MKARISAGKALFYHGGFQAHRKTCDVLKRLSIPTVTVEPARLDLPLDVLMADGKASRGSYAGEAPTPGCLVVSQLSDDMLDRLIIELRREDARPDLLAVVTPSNRKWTFLKLIGELSDERDNLEQQNLQ